MSRAKKLVKTTGIDLETKELLVNFHPGFPPAGKKVSHLHNMKEAPNPNGNRAERRAAKKLRKKKNAE